LIPLLCALIVAVAVVWAGWQITRQLAARRDEGGRRLQLMALFAPAIAAAVDDPRVLLTWQPLARAARTLWPSDFQALDQAAGALFPFSPDQIQAAHARWTTEWLTWERAHDADFKLKTLLLQQELGDAAATAVGRGRLEAIEREKLESYQRRYEEYTRVSRALQALLPR
jgi:hypothetical protein